MIQVLFILCILWLIVTLVGHVTWIALAAMFRQIFGGDGEASLKQAISRQSELAAAKSVIDRLVVEGFIAAREADRLRNHIRALEHSSRPATSPQPPSPNATTPRPLEVPSAVPRPETGQTAAKVKTTAIAPLGPAVSATLPSPPAAAETPAQSESGSPRASLGQSIGEFLADHNIRWGELIAGVLIVACSIGLVVSLWSTITQMHRVIPSLIFLSGNAAIFAAGMYTLFRWRLPDTSRATLVIATLLVPLGILTGLSTGGVDANAVRLNDPVTLVGILGAGTIYLLLIWLASRALVGSAIGVAMTIAVAGSSAVLPIVPASIRNWDAAAGYVVYGASAAIALATLRLARLGLRRNHRSAKRWAMVLGVGVFSFAVAALYTAYMLREVPSGWLTIAVAAVPAWIFAAGVAETIARKTSNATLALSASWVAICGILASCVVFVPAMQSMHWIWMWAVSLSAAAGLTAVMFRGATWTGTASVPIGIAVLVSSPVWFNDQAWSTIDVWHRFLGGPPMLAALAIGMLTFAVAGLFRASDHRRALLFCGGGWSGVALFNALALVVLPSDWMGGVPSWVLPILLASGGLAVSLTGRRLPLDATWWVFTFYVFVVGAWCSIWRPLEAESAWLAARLWLQVALVAGIVGVLVAEVIPRCRRVRRLYRRYAAALIGVASVLAMAMLLDFEGDPRTIRLALAVLPIAWALWNWIGFSDRDPIYLALSRLLVAAGVAVIGYRFFFGQLYSLAAWRTGSAVWAWSAVGWVMVVAIGLRTQCLAVMHRFDDPPTKFPLNRQSWQPNLHLSMSRLIRRTRWYVPADHPWDRDSFAMLIQSAAVVSIVAASFGWVSTMIQLHFGRAVSVDPRLAVPMAVLAVGSAILHYRMTTDKLHTFAWTALRPMIGSAAMVWAAWQLATRWFDAVEPRLMAATSLAAAGCFVLDWVWRTPIRYGNRFDGRGLSTVVGLVLIAVSSISLIAEDWANACWQGIAPEASVTLCVGAWWLAAAGAAIGFGYRSGKQWGGMVAAVLVPATVILIMPLSWPRGWWQWIQAAGIADGALLAVLVGLTELKRKSRPSWNGFAFGTDVALAASAGVGLASCIGVYGAVLFDSEALRQLHNLFGVSASLTAAIVLLFWNRFGSGVLRLAAPVRWTSLLLLLAANGSVWIDDLLGVSVSAAEVLAVLWVLIAAVSVGECWRLGGRDQTSAKQERWQAVCLAVATPWLVWFLSNATWTLGVALSACGIAGLLAAIRGRELVAIAAEDVRPSTRMPTRLLCWYVVAAGGLLLWRVFEVTRIDEATLWTLLLVWPAGWIIAWRWLCPRPSSPSQTDRPRFSPLADFEASLLLTLGFAGEAYLMCCWPGKLSAFGTIEDPMLWVRLTIGFAALASVAFRWPHGEALSLGVVTCLSVSTTAAMHAIGDAEIGFVARVTALSLTIASVYTLLVFTSASITALASGLNRFAFSTDRHMVTQPPLKSLNFSRALGNIVWVPALLAAGIGFYVLIDANADRIAPLAICSVAMIAVAAAEVSERTGLARLRYAAVAYGLIAVAMWASCAIESHQLPALTLTSRWFVAWVCTAILFAFLLPRSLAGATWERWRGAIKAGLAASCLLACASLSATLIQEAIVRLDDQTERLIKPLYLGVAAVLAMISGLTAVAGIISGPGFRYREDWQLTDRQRSLLIVAAQVFGGLTWFHLFLCESPLAGFGLRPYWPYVVMVLSFASVGITEWARRREDQVLSTTLKQTALYLPLVPVIGFWLSGTGFGETGTTDVTTSWTFLHGRVSYQVLLICAAVYYAVVSFLWKSGPAKLASVIIGNAALWVILVQTPNWDFLSHPQAWLIPPAVCVLALAHFYRQALGGAATSAIRYAATLVIYISSTADMLIQGIGSTLAGPIILIALALLGAAAGVALRVRPFLYLGTTFIVFAVTSMVWHAQTQIGAVWPWWVFGIGTGIVLMIGLMAIEKNKPRLRQLALSMQQWEA